MFLFQLLSNAKYITHTYLIFCVQFDIPSGHATFLTAAIYFRASSPGRLHGLAVSDLLLNQSSNTSSDFFFNVFFTGYN